MQQAFRGRKKDPTQNVMVAVDFDLMFTYVLVGWEGSAHDAIILADAIERDDGFTYVLAGWEGFAHDAIILADAIERDDGFTVPQGNCINKSMKVLT
jgi:hypothetical protein